ncbi:hypothetical protein Tco_0890193 [Tanacetum coccineum]|uniref:Uncharacterized protein n=1 Tax=Tanacetum coccineum TaxID=301880 RepID=A0ABQ5BZE4_9ASTR
MEKELHNRMGKSGWLPTGTRYSKGTLSKVAKVAKPISVYMSEVDGKFNFSPVSVNFRTEVAKVDEQAGNSQKNRYVTGAFCNGVINVKDAVERQHINEAEADI